MTNLTDKFDATNEKIDTGNAAIIAKLDTLRNEQSAAANALSTQLAQQHTNLMALLETMNSNLQIIAEAATSTQPDPTAALTAILQELKDIHLDTQSLDIKLLRIRDAISPIGEAFPTGTRTSILWCTYRLMMAVNSTILTGSTGSVANLMQAMLSSMVPPLNNISTQASAINANIGQNVGDATTTALGLLSSIQYSNSGINASIGPIAPSELTVRQLLAQQSSSDDCGCTTAKPNPLSCNAPYISTGMSFTPTALIPGVDNVTYAYWPDYIPLGLQYGDIFGLPIDDHTTLVREGGLSWDGYRLYVQSSAATYADRLNAADPIGSLTRYPTGQWRSLTGIYQLSVIVPGNASVMAYLCLPGGNPLPTDCITADSQIVSFSDSEQTRSCAVWPSTLAQRQIPDIPGESASLPVFLVGDYSGWTVMSTRPNVKLFVYDPLYQDANIPAAGVTIVGPTMYIAVFNVEDADAFSVTLCPPATGGA